MAKVKEIVSFLLERFPLDLCSDFDKGKVGLQFGNPEANVSKVMVALDATSKVVSEAINSDCQMIISHHPFMFSPMLNLNYTSPNGKKMLNVFKHELNIFAMHTNFDCASEGMNDILANRLGLKDIKVVDEVEKDNFVRIGTVDKMSLKDFASVVKTKLKQNHVRVVGDVNKQISKVAIIGGAGGSFVVPAAYLGCDVLVTGEIRHNNAIDAIDYGISCIEVSHGVEALYKEEVIKLLNDTFNDVEFINSFEDQDPFKSL